MTEQEQKAFTAMREALESSAVCIQLMSDGPSRASWGDTLDIIDSALTAANAVSESALMHVDFQDMYWKEKRRAEMWVAKYENDIGPLKKAYPQATEPAWKPIESVPKDGTMVMCWVSAVQYGETDEGQQFQRDISQIDFGSWEDGLDGNGYFDPYCGQIGDHQHVTHWMQLPPPPETK